MTKAWKYIEPVVGLTCALIGVPPLAIVGAVNGAKLIAAAKENWDGRSLDFETLASSMRMAALRAADRFDVDQTERDALTEADAAMADHLVSCLPTHEELAAFARKPDLAATVASHVVDRLAAHDPRPRRSGERTFTERHGDGRRDRGRAGRGGFDRRGAPLRCGSPRLRSRGSRRRARCAPDP